MTRYLLQYLMPLAMLALVIYLGTNLRRDHDTSEGARDRNLFLLIFIVGAVVAMVLGYLVYQYLET